LDWFQWIADQKAQRAGTGHFFEVPRRDVAEVDRFVAQWPEVASRIGLEPTPPKLRLFDAGQAWYQTVSQGVSLGGPFFLDVLEAHTSLDHGVFGDDNEIVASNMAALASRSGAIRSRYILPTAEQERWPRPEINTGYFLDRPTRFVVVVTAISPRRNETILFVEVAASGPSSSSVSPDFAIAGTLEQFPKKAPESEWKPEPYTEPEPHPFDAKHPWAGGFSHPKIPK
jgi:hypothetical protein